MSSYGLKTNIALNISVLVLCGMLLTVFMLTMLFQRLLINNEVKNGLYVVSILEEIIRVDDSVGSSTGINSSYGLRKALINSGVSNSVFVYPESNRKYEFGESSVDTHDLEEFANKAFLLDDPEVTFSGNGWGVFWKHKTELIISAPIYKKNEKVAGICLVIPLKKLFFNIRKLLNIVFIYVLINAGVLTIAGVYQISKSAVKPVHRLLKRANAYHDENSPIIFEEKTGNEFKKLSGALNNMLGRISDDKKKLQETVNSLEVTNEELKKAQKDIVRAEKLASVGRLSSGIAHEIGNPLGIVGGYLELMKDDDQPLDQKNDFIERAEKELQRIDRIIRQLLDYSRKSKETTSAVSVNDVVIDIVEMVKVQPFMSDIEIDIDSASKDIRVLANYDQLKQVFLNLFVNAADAINSIEDKIDGNIKIRYEKTEVDTIIISFKDNGSGISDEDIGNVFDPFFTTKEPGKGTGLGLSVCFMIIESFDGELTIESKEGGGTGIKIELPLANKLQEHV